MDRLCRCGAPAVNRKGPPACEACVTKPRNQRRRYYWKHRKDILAKHRRWYAENGDYQRKRELARIRRKRRDPDYSAAERAKTRVRMRRLRDARRRERLRVDTDYRARFMARLSEIHRAAYGAGCARADVTLDKIAAAAKLGQ